MDLVRRSIDEDIKLTVLLISGGFRIRTQLVPIRKNPSDHRASSVLVMSEEIKAVIYDRIVNAPPRDDELVVHSELVNLGQLSPLSTRELEVLALMRQGMRTSEIADELYRSVSTVQRHRESIGKKLDMHDRSEIIELANIAVLQVEDAHRTRF
jgi:DNA-binding NarL/FixJ family response regulator